MRAYDVPLTVFDGGDIRIIGLSDRLLVNNNPSRISTLEARIAYLDEEYPAMYEAEEEEITLEYNLKGFLVWNGNESENRGLSPKFWTVNLLECKKKGEHKMEKEKIIKFAKAEGYDSAEYAGQWLDYEIYHPYFEGEDELHPAIVGLPFSILVKGENIRMSTTEEIFQILDELYDDEEGVDDEE